MNVSETGEAAATRLSVFTMTPNEERETASVLARAVAQLTEQLADYNALKEEVWKLRLIEKDLKEVQSMNAQLMADKSALEQEVALSGAQKSARRREYLVASVPKVLCLGIVLTAMPCMILCIANVIPIKYFTLPFWAMGTSAMYLSLSLRPSDAFAIRVVSAMMAMNMNPLQQAPFFAALPLMWIFVKLEHETPERPVSSIKVDILVIMVWMTLMFTPLGLYCWRRLLVTRDGKRMPWFQDKELVKWAKARYGPLKGGMLANALPIPWAIKQQLDNNFAVPPRTAMLRMYLTLRVTFAVALAAVCAYQLARILLEGDTFSDDERFFHYLTCASTGWFAVSTPLIMAPVVRNKYHSCLASIATRGEAGRAAGVAALIGKRDVKSVLAAARRSFLGVPFDRMREAHFATNAADASMHALPVRCHLGQVDAFLSHSWHDDPSSKWYTLSEWAASFEHDAGRPPTLWFDKACLNQDDIEAQLASLPIFLAGSRALLCLVGPTYTQRIWCVMEIFTFLRMGGTQEKLQVRPVHETRDGQGPTGAWGPSASDDELLSLALEHFRAFDVAECRCFDEGQLQHLLGVIELGFSSFDMFNSLVRNAFANKLEEVMSHTQAKGGAAADTKSWRSGGPCGGPARSSASTSNNSLLRGGSFLPVAPAQVLPHTAPQSGGGKEIAPGAEAQLETELEAIPLDP
jgi:hypothetical protein